MKNVMIGLSLALLAAGTAYAVDGGQAKPDADGNGVVTRAEAQAHAARMFARFDVNKDGKLDAADREARRAAMFDRIDSNKDGQISRAEFAAAHPQRPGAADDAGQGPDHRMSDRHMGGHHMGDHGMGDHRDGPMMMARMADTDKDGAVSQAEFTAAALQHFDQADTNKDGQVTKEERQAAHRQMREHMRERMHDHMDGGMHDGMHDHMDGPDAPPAN